MKKLSIFLHPLFILLSLTPLSAAQNTDAGKGSTAATGDLWCVAKNNAEDAALQSALDWACGAGGANCAPIQSGGPCYDPSDIVRTASYAFNDYYLKHGTSSESCNFSNSAELSGLNPSFGNCKIPSSSNGSKGSLGMVGGGVNGPNSADSSNGNSVFARLQWIVVIIPLFFLIPMIDP